MNPNFLGIGVPKAGTTWLYENLRQHPQVWLPPAKEIHYFDRSRRPYLADLWHRNYQRRYLLWRWLKPSLADMRRNPQHLGWHLRFFLDVRTPSWYQSLFRPDPHQITGDITPTYSVLSESTITRIAQTLPHVKLILILRNPIDRIWSHAAMYFSRYGQRGLHHATNEAIQTFLQAPHMHQRSDYVTILERWQHAFPPEQLHISFYDDLVADPAQFFLNICGFLDIEPIIPEAVCEPIHSRSYPSMPEWATLQLQKRYRPIIETLANELDTPIPITWLASIDSH